MESYNLNDLVNQYEWIYMEIIQDLYGENHKRELKKNLIAKYLSKHGYYQVKQTPGLCKHVWRPISFTFVVDEFGIDHFGRDDTDHLMSALEIYHE